jgi:ribosomal protein S14
MCAKNAANSGILKDSTIKDESSKVVLSAMNPPAKASRRCKQCGKELRQKYYQYCVVCRKARRKYSREVRKLRWGVKNALKPRANTSGMMMKNGRRSKIGTEASRR